MTSSFSRMRFESNLGLLMPAPTSTRVPARFSCASADSIAALWPLHSSTTSKGSATRSCGITGVRTHPAVVVGADAPTIGAERRPLGEAVLAAPASRCRAAHDTVTGAPFRDLGAHSHDDS